METKEITLSLKKAKVVIIEADLGDLEEYKNAFLKLKNHERETSEILEVRGRLNSNRVRVVLLIEADETEENELERCKAFVEQFCESIESAKVETAYLLMKDELMSATRCEDVYIYA